VADYRDNGLELGQVYVSLIAAFREGGGGDRSRDWLADEIEQQVRNAEDDARRGWLAEHPLATLKPTHFLTDAARIEIALRIAYHYLVVLPGMWAHVQDYWGRSFPGGVRLYLEDSNEPAISDSELMQQDTDTAAGALRELANDLHTRFPDEVHLYDWLYKAEERHHGH
jgi:hypothetical protein